jgi:peptide/nickel transport system permease protein
MPFQPVFLWTDILIYLLLAASFSVLFYALQKEHLRVPLKQIRRKPMAMAAAMVLLCYLFVGLADSLHFRLSSGGGAVMSLLDLGVGPLRTNVEKTYSMPLDIQSYAKETVEDATGKKSRLYPRLLYAAVNITTDTDRISDIYQTGIAGGLRGLLVASLFIMICISLISRVHHTSWMTTARGIFQGQYDTAWRSIFLMGTGLLILFFTLAPLSVRYHLLGTDKVGQDVLYLSLKAIRTGLVIGTLTTLIMLPFAVFLGIGAGYFKGKIDDIIQYLYTTLSSIPGVLLIAAAVLILQIYMDTHADAFADIAQRADVRLFFLCLILGTTGWIGLCRLLRGETLKLSELEYIQAAKALGVGNGTILVRHILPNVMHIVLIAAVLDFSGLVLAEAVLSYVGIGVDPTMISWGNMINSARLEMAREPIVWWSLVSAFVFMLGLVLSANLVSDAVRDAFDPRLRGRTN